MEIYSLFTFNNTPSSTLNKERYYSLFSNKYLANYAHDTLHYSTHNIASNTAIITTQHEALIIYPPAL